MNILPKTVKTLLISVAVLFALPGHATVYNMIPDGVTYRNASNASATLETDRIGMFTMFEAPGIFNTSRYSFSMYDNNNVRAHFDNTNSSWHLLDGGSGTITITPTEMTFQFSTPSEYSSEYLYVRSVQPDGRWFSADFAQFNNISNGMFFYLDFDATHSAEQNYSYNSTMIFKAVSQVPEPSTYLLALLGLTALAFARSAMPRFKRTR